MKRFWLFFSQATTLLLAAYFVISTLKPTWMGPRGETAIALLQAPPSPSGQVPAGSFRLASQKASKAVVSINVSKTSRASPLGPDPWHRFFNGEPDSESQGGSGMGSGVIVSDSGYVLTNNHVVEGADLIEVILYDRRRTRARVIGTDPDTDLAVLKIELDRLPVMVLGDSDDLQVGDQVLAIGNPFGVGQTVTAGIVSALGRNQLGINTFENFIQTDAAINPGNSGGALIDTQGNLLGINTAIYSRSGGSMGIGFAIPANTAQHVMEGLIQDGQVTRGWIGIEPRDLTAEIAQSLNLPVSQGVLITGVLQDGPAGLAGMRPGDVVLKIAGKTVINTSQLLNAVASLKPQSEATIGIQRGTESLTLNVTVVQRPKGLANGRR